MAKLLIKFPTRNRWKVFQNTFNLYYSMLSGKHEVEFRITMDIDDGQMNRDEVKSFLDSKKNVLFCYGYNGCKVGAINANMEDASFDALILASDDMLPKIEGYDDIVMTKMQEHYPELDGALWFNDGRVGNQLCTLSIMGKKLYDRFGYIYHPDYKSLWCDNEYHQVCHQWNKMTYIDQVIIQHAWTDVTGGDPLHVRNESFYERDRRVFEARRSAGYPTVGIQLPIERPKDQRRRQIVDRRRRGS